MHVPALAVVVLVTAPPAVFVVSVSQGNVAVAVTAIPGKRGVFVAAAAAAATSKEDSMVGLCYFVVFLSFVFVEIVFYE